MVMALAWRRHGQAARATGNARRHPGQQRSEVGDLVVGDPSQHVGKPGLGIDVVEPGRLNQRQHDRGALAAAIRTGEQPRLPTERYCPFILPMSGRSWKSTTGIIHCCPAILPGA
jgi:hypothetical protein